MAREFYRKYDAWYQAQNQDGSYGPGPGIGPLMWHLRNLDLKDFDPRSAAPETEAMRNMVAAGRFPVEEWARAVAEDPDHVKGFPPDVSLLTPTQCFHAWQAYNGGPDKATSQHVGIALSKVGLRRVYGGMKVLCAEGKLYLWAIRDKQRVLALNHRELASLRNKETKDEEDTRARIQNLEILR
jgi:hypothetical protein